MATGQARANRYRAIVAGAHLPDRGLPWWCATGVGGQSCFLMTRGDSAEP